MSNFYEDIALRTNGDIYIGVVGPVRTGKSTFITQFMNQLVLPNVTNKFDKERMVDELPVSAEGVTVMTSQPKFVPNEAIRVNLENTDMKVRLIDCVGYLVDGVSGHMENNKPRLVKTPWKEENMTFQESAEFGTRKVITEHSTVGVLVTTDGSFLDLPRQNYVESEERVVNELKQSDKPFVIVLNTTNPESDSAQRLAQELRQKYNVPVLAINVAQLSRLDIDSIIENLLTQFDIDQIDIDIPEWLEVLDYSHPLIQEISQTMLSTCQASSKIADLKNANEMLSESENYLPVSTPLVMVGEGKIVFKVEAKPELFYKVLSLQCEKEISNNLELVSYMQELSVAKREYDKIANALNDVKETGYGVVQPSFEDMQLDEPKMVKTGGRFGIKLKATAPSLHIMRVDVEAEVSPIVGTEAQGEDLVKNLMRDFETNPQAIWQTNMFGKSLNVLVRENLASKLTQMPPDAQRKMRKTLGRIINEGRGGVLCILL